MSHTKYIIIGTVILAVVVLLNLPASMVVRVKGGVRDNFIPFQNVLSLMTGKLRDATSVIFKARDIIRKKEAMLEEVAMLRAESRGTEELERQNRELRDQLKFAKRSKYKLIFCEVIMRNDISGWWRIVRLNKGSEDGISCNKAVITTEGLAGRTIDVSKRTCDVLLITDPNCRVAGKFSRTGAYGIVSGSGVSGKNKAVLDMLYPIKPCVMEYISKDKEVWSRDEVVTSGLGGIFPEGILIGSVARFSEDSTELYKRADITPAADLGLLKYVFVVAD